MSDTNSWGGSGTGSTLMGGAKGATDFSGTTLVIRSTDVYGNENPDHVIRNADSYNNIEFKREVENENQEGL